MLQTTLNIQFIIESANSEYMKFEFSVLNSNKAIPSMPQKFTISTNLHLKISKESSLSRIEINEGWELSREVGERFFEMRFRGVAFLYIQVQINESNSCSTVIDESSIKRT